MPCAEDPLELIGFPSQLSLEWSPASCEGTDMQFKRLDFGDPCNLDVLATLLEGKVRLFFNAGVFCSCLLALESPNSLDSARRV